MPAAAATRNRRVPLRTIDDIERHAHEVSDAEHDAAGAIRDLLRELAVRLPVDSKFVHRFAQCARALDGYVVLRAGTAGMAAFDVTMLVRDIIEHFEEAEGE